MGKVWLHICNLLIVLLILLCSRVRMQTCINSTSQSTIKYTTYTDGGVEFAPYDVVVDSSGNQYLVYAFALSNQVVHVSKINSNGTIGWSRNYTNFIMKPKFKSTQISSDGFTLRMIGQDSSAACQFVQIRTSDGDVTSSDSCGSMRFTSESFQTTISCSPNTDSICYFIAANSSTLSDYRTCKVDFSSRTTILYADPDGSNHHLSTITALDDDQMIAGGFEVSSTPKYFFYNYNFNSNSTVWVMESATIEDAYSSNSSRTMSTFVNDDTTKFFAILKLSLLPVVIVLNPADGSLIEARKIEYSVTFSSSKFQASGQISNSMLMLSIATSSPNYNVLSFINFDTWELTSYVSESSLFLNGFSSLFQTNQIVLLFEGNSPTYFSLQTVYDKLNLTELYNQETSTLANVTTDLSFTEPMVTISNSSESPGSLSASGSFPTLLTDADKTYEVTANIFSSSVASFAGDISNTTSLGPVEFDCYTATTNATNANFSNQLTMTQSDGQVIPSWMTFDSSTAGISLTSPEVSSGTYNVTNSYTGVFLNFTLNTQIVINLTDASTQTNNGTNNDDDDYCLGASSEGLCAFFVILIIFAVLGPIILIAILIYVKYKCCKGSNDCTRLDQAQPDEGERGEEDNKCQEDDESVQMNQYRNIQPDTENVAAQDVEDIQNNQI